MKSIFCDPYDFETTYDIKSIELHCADLTNFTKQEIDILVISAFEYGYKPTKGTVIGSLFNKGIDIKKLSGVKTKSLEFSISKKLFSDPIVPTTKVGIHLISKLSFKE